MPRAALGSDEADGGTRERILAAALLEFARAGFDGASTRDIARAAAANQGLVTYHFGGKDGLWRAAIEHGLSRLGAALAEADLRALPRAASCEAQVELVFAHVAVVRAVLHEATRGGPRLRWLARRPLLRSLTGTLDAPDPHEPAAAVFLFGAAVACACGPLLRECSGSHRDLDSAADRRLLAAVLARTFEAPSTPGGEWSRHPRRGTLGA